MTKRRFLVALIGLFNCALLLAQKQDRVWCFGDSTGIDFNDLNNPKAITTAVGPWSLECYSSIADKNGNLLFYAAGVDDLNTSFVGVRVWNRQHTLMLNGDSIKGHPSVTQGTMIVPFPNDENKYYLFTLGFNMDYTRDVLYYSIIDMQLDNGLGGVTTKNTSLLEDSLTEKMTAVKHSNGRDWWLVVVGYNPINRFYKYLITGRGFIQGPFIQDIGQNIIGVFGEMEFSRKGDRLVAVTPNGNIELFDFDRCSGNLSNNINIGENIGGFGYYYYGCSFSEDGKVLYVSPFHVLSRNIYQYDLTAKDIQATKTIVYAYPDSIMYMELGGHQIGPNNKIYVGKGAGENANYTIYNTNIDVINSPNNLGAVCAYVSNSFSLGGHSVHYCLPNMPNYNLGEFFIKQASAGENRKIYVGEEVRIGGEITYPNCTVQWYPALGLSDANSAQPTASPTKTTTYYLTLTDTTLQNNCNITTDSVVVAIISAFSLYPTLSNGSITVTCPVQKQANASLIITDILGQRVASYSLQKGDNNISLPELAAAMYLYQIVVDEVVVKKDKMVVVK